MTSVSRAAQSPAPADDPEAAGPEEDSPAAAPLFDNYLSPDRPNPAAYDEMFSPDGSIRGPYRALHEAIAPTAAADLKVRSEALDRAYVDQGITFSLSGKERPFPLDIVPRVISARNGPSCSAASCSASRHWRCSSPTSTATPRSSATVCCRGV